MSPTAAMLGASTIVGMATGQILFKIATQRGGVGGILLSPVFWAAIVLYGVVTLLWVSLLRELDLSRAYPIVAAATFVLVPAASVVILGEKVSLNYIIGLALIIAGVAVTARA